MKVRRLVLGTVLLSVVVISGCSNATWSGVKAWGKEHHIKQFSGGVLIGEWLSTGKIENEEHSDGYYFEDDATRTMISISGDVQIFVVKEPEVTKIRARLAAEQSAKESAETARVEKSSRG